MTKPSTEKVSAKQNVKNDCDAWQQEYVNKHPWHQKKKDNHLVEYDDIPASGHLI